MELTPGHVSFQRPLLHVEADQYLPLNDQISTTFDKTQDQVWQELTRFYAENEQTIERAASLNISTDVKSVDPSELNISIDTFTETTKVVLDGLVMLGNVHPILGVAIFAFHSVISLDLTRRDNNKKVIAVKLQMQNMMCTMFQLRKLKHVHAQGQEREQQRSHLQRLVKVIANDITACGSDLNYYMDRKFIAKLVNAKIYEHRFAAHIDTFVQRRSELQGMISAYTSAGVDFANTTLIALGHKLGSMDDKLDAVFRALDTAREKEALKFIEENGGAETCIVKEELFQRLMVKTGEVSKSSKNPDIQREELVELRRTLLLEVTENLQDALAKNHARFEKLLAVQNNNLERISDRIEEHGLRMQGHDMKLDRLVSTTLLILEEGRLVRKAVIPSSTIKLKDPDLQQIWDRMGLKRSVKAKTFVLTFRDHLLSDRSAMNTPFVQPLSPLHPGSSPLLLTTEEIATDNQPVITATGADPDVWLLKYIDVTHVRPIVEAIDEDGSGFISVKEANKFALSRPTGWSLLRWMAYWAAGWHISITNYRSQLYALIRQMHVALDSVLPVNRFYTDHYFDHWNILHSLEGMLRSTNPLPEAALREPRLSELVNEMSDLTEQRILKNLKGVSYTIKSASDVTLIVGSGRVEAWIYPLLYLLLSRHLDIVRLGQKVVLDPSEMATHTLSLSSVFSVFYERKSRLEAIFRQMYRDVEAQFKSYAYGMFFTAFKGQDTKLSDNTLLTYKDEDSGVAVVSADTPDQSILVEGIGPMLDYKEITIPSVSAPQSGSMHAIQGTWLGLLTGKNESTQRLTHQICFELVLGPIVGSRLYGAGRSFYSPTDVDGYVELLNEGTRTTSPIFFRMMRSEIDEEEILCHGTYDEETQTIRGAWIYHDASEALSFPIADAEFKTQIESLVDDNNLGYFYMTKGSADIFRFQYLLHDLERKPAWTLARRRWVFAIETTLFKVQRDMGSWAFFRARIAERKRLAELLMRTWLTTSGSRGYITDDEVAERLCLMGNLHPTIVNITRELASYYYDRRTFSITNAVCDACSQYIVFSRFVCITCQEETFNNEVDMCAECIDSTEFTNTSIFLHHPSHPLIRFTRRLYYSQRPVIIPQARMLAAKIQASFKASGVTNATTVHLSSDAGKLTKGDQDQIIMSRPLLAVLICTSCGKNLTLPCWACVACEQDTLLCPECEGEGKPIEKWKSPSKHLQQHPLLRISHIEEVKINELKATKLERNLENTMDTVAGLEQKVNSQFQEVKSLLDEVAKKLEQPPDEVRSTVLQAALNASPQTGSTDFMTLGSPEQGKNADSSPRDDKFKALEDRLDRLEQKVDTQFGTLTSLMQELVATAKSQHVVNN